MWLELLLLGIILIGIAVLFYRGAIHEFQILQHDWSEDLNWANLLSERSPLVIRDLPVELQGTWRKTAVAQRNWPVHLHTSSGSFRTPLSDWIETPIAHMQEFTLQNGERLAKSVGLPDTIGDWRSAGMGRWTWLPSSSCSVHLLPPIDGTCLPLRQIRSDCQFLVCTDGSPLLLWLAHEGSIPSKHSLEGKNPWTFTNIDIKYMELRLRPGQAIVLPTHWWVAAKCELPIVSDAPRIGDGSWCWTADLDTPVSWVVRTLPRGSKK